MFTENELELLKEVVDNTLKHATKKLGEMEERVGCGYHPMDITCQESRVAELTALRDKVVEVFK